MAWSFLKTKKTLRIKTQDLVSHISPFIRLPRSLNQHSVSPTCSLGHCARLHLVPQSDPFRDGLRVTLGGNECSGPAGVQVLAAQHRPEMPSMGILTGRLSALSLCDAPLSLPPACRGWALAPLHKYVQPPCRKPQLTPLQAPEWGSDPGKLSSCPPPPANLPPVGSKCPES